MTLTSPDNVWAKIDATGPCWLWTGARNTNGYGSVRYAGRSRSAHHVVHELLVGDLPDGLEADHLCRVRHCVNPDHIEWVTRSVNMQRAATYRKFDGQVPLCTHGHRVEGDNALSDNNPRRKHPLCRRCHTDK